MVAWLADDVLIKSSKGVTGEEGHMKGPLREQGRQETECNG